MIMNQLLRRLQVSQTKQTASQVPLSFYTLQAKHAAQSFGALAYLVTITAPTPGLLTPR